MIDYIIFPVLPLPPPKRPQNNELPSAPGNCIIEPVSRGYRRWGKYMRWGGQEVRGAHEVGGLAGEGVGGYRLYMVCRGP